MDALTSPPIVVIDLPMPPTTNNLFAGVGRKRVKTPKYEAWIREAGWALIRHRPPRITGPVIVTIEVSDTESSSTWDLCNREKATMDLLVAHRILQGDNKPFVREFHMRWSPDIAGVRVTLQPLEEQQSLGEAMRAAAARMEVAQ